VAREFQVEYFIAASGKLLFTGLGIRLGSAPALAALGRRWTVVALTTGDGVDGQHEGNECNRVGRDEKSDRPSLKNLRDNPSGLGVPVRRFARQQCIFAKL
jgi:hypothetical protein